MPLPRHTIIGKTKRNEQFVMACGVGQLTLNCRWLYTILFGRVFFYSAAFGSFANQPASPTKQVGIHVAFCTMYILYNMLFFRSHFQRIVLATQQKTEACLSYSWFAVCVSHVHFH